MKTEDRTHRAFNSSGYVSQQQKWL